MTDDPLASAVRALHQRYEGRSDRAGETEAKILDRLTSPRTLRLRWPLPLAAFFIGSTAWAGSQGHLGTWVQGALLAVVAPAPSEEAQGKTSRFVRSSFSSARERDAEVPAFEEPVEPSRSTGQAGELLPAPAGSSEVSSNAVERKDANGGEQRASRSVESPEATRETSRVGAAPEEPLSVYQRAHQSHFKEQDFAEALRAWNLYLRLDPGGPLALEARYNRALALLRLGRTLEAREALQPFARGEYGEYRRREATQLSEHIDGTL